MPELTLVVFPRHMEALEVDNLPLGVASISVFKPLSSSTVSVSDLLLPKHDNLIVIDLLNNPPKADCDGWNTKAYPCPKSNFIRCRNTRARACLSACASTINARCATIATTVVCGIIAVPTVENHS
jgi:hypothetical protein